MQLHSGAPALQSHRQARQGVQLPVAAAAKQPHPSLQQDRPRAADFFLDRDNHKDLRNDKEAMYKYKAERNELKLFAEMKTNPKALYKYTL